jgi:hypothetical protein
MFSGFGRRNTKDEKPTMNVGEAELYIDEAYIADKGRSIARIDRQSMKKLHISGGDAVIIFADEQPVILKAFPVYPSDNNSGIIRLSAPVRKQLRREVGDAVTVRGIGNTKIDKVVNYLMFEELGKKGN